MAKLYREKLEIMRDVLESCEGGSRVSRIAQKSHLTTAKAHEYIDFLIEKQFIVHDVYSEPRTQKAKKDIDVYDRYLTTPLGLDLRQKLDFVIEELM